jgi:hypothetical protein
MGDEKRLPGAELSAPAAVFHRERSPNGARNLP